MITQIPTLIALLQRINYPHTHILQRELSRGFPLLGQLQPGLQWHIRSDKKYTDPHSMGTLRTCNQDYILKKLNNPNVDDNWELMADEIATEVRSGRMRGHRPTSGTTDQAPHADNTTSTWKPNHRHGIQHQTNRIRRQPQDQTR